MREVDRLGVIREVVGKHLRQREAGERMGLSVRQVKRLLRRYRELGARGLISGHRGRKANNAIAPEVRAEILGVVRERYEDFSPTLAWEKLREVHGYGVSVETLRKWMAEEGLWRSRKRRGMRVHQSRPRRPALGELVQIDGSPHRWFEDRGPYCTLIVFIDDATSRLMALRFAEAETTEAYMRTLRGYLDQYGRPVALYSDKHSIFRVNQQDCEGELTQFTRALKTLDIQPIHANTPRLDRSCRPSRGCVKPVGNRWLEERPRGCPQATPGAVGAPTCTRAHPNPTKGHFSFAQRGHFSFGLTGLQKAVVECPIHQSGDARFDHSFRYVREYIRPDDLKGMGEGYVVYRVVRESDLLKLRHTGADEAIMAETFEVFTPAMEWAVRAARQE